MHTLASSICPGCPSPATGSLSLAGIRRCYRIRRWSCSLIWCCHRNWTEFPKNFYVINCLLTSPFKSFLLMLGIFFGSFWFLLDPFRAHRVFWKFRIPKCSLLNGGSWMHFDAKSSSPLMCIELDCFSSVLPDSFFNWTFLLKFSFWIIFIRNFWLESFGNYRGLLRASNRNFESHSMQTKRWAKTTYTHFVGEKRQINFKALFSL